MSRLVHLRIIEMRLARLRGGEERTCLPQPPSQTEFFITNQLLASLSEYTFNRGYLFYTGHHALYILNIDPTLVVGLIHDKSRTRVGV